MRELWKKGNYVIEKIMKDHVGAYAAQSAFFMVLSLVPILLLLMTLVRYTPVTQMDIMQVVNDIFPKTIRSTIISIVN